MNAAKILGLVAAGGKSSRMGRDKALIPLSDGRTMLAHAYCKICALSDFALVSCARGRVYAGYPCLEDNFAAVGPMGGIATGLAFAKKAGFGQMLVLGCDLPLVDEGLLERLLARHLSQNCPISCYEHRESGLLECLVGVYSPAALPLLAAALARGDYSLRLLAQGQNRVPIEPRDVHKFVNCNRPRDLAGL